MLFNMQCWKHEKAAAHFFIDSWFIQLWFCYNACVNSHSQLLAVWKVTDTKMSFCKHIEQGHIWVKKTSAATCLFGHVIDQGNHLIYKCQSNRLINTSYCFQQQVWRRKLCFSLFHSSFNFSKFNPLIPRSDSHVTSPYNI